MSNFRMDKGSRAVSHISGCSGKTISDTAKMLFQLYFLNKDILVTPEVFEVKFSV